MSETPRVVDGADRRKQRLLELLAYIHNVGGASTLELKTFMLARFGLKHKTTSEYIAELHLGKLIEQGGADHVGKWFTTNQYKKFVKYLYG